MGRGLREALRHRPRRLRDAGTDPEGQLRLVPRCDRRERLLSSDAARLVERLLAGDRRALARALTAVEDGDEATLRGLLARLHPHTGGAHLVGVTGAPGAGKSTLTAALIGRWRRRGRRVGVLAVDPSSPFSGGALLGDRVRMGAHVMDEGVFVRSVASRGHLGGLSRATPQALAVLDAAGHDVVVLETVGVGQAEVEVAGVADSTIVVVAPGMGDAVQAAKAGILEVADVFAVNKADRDGAERTIAELEEMQRLGHGAWRAPIVRTIAPRDEGIVELVDALDAHRSWLGEDGRLAARRLDRARLQVRELALAALRARMGEIDGGGVLEEVAGRVAAGELDPYAGADEVVAGVSRFRPRG